MIFLYRNNEIGFRKWATTYIRKAEQIVNMFSMYKPLNENYYNEKQKEYKEAVKVLNEFNSLLLLLNNEELDFFERAIVKNGIIDDINKNKVFLIKEIIFKKWQSICFKNNKLRISKIDNKSLGNELKRLRTYYSLSVTAVANALGIKPGTLRNYELGNRTISVNTLYGLAQIYHVDIEKLLLQNS